MDCRSLREQLDAYVDSELEPALVMSVEQHLGECGDCRNELAVLRLVQQGVRTASEVRVPAGLELRLSKALDAADVDDGRRKPARSPWGYAFGAAAVLTLTFGAAARLSAPGRGGQTGVATADLAALGLLGDVVQRHVDQLPADITAERPEQVTSWSRGKVGFRVRSIEFAEPQVHLVGARISHVGAQPALKLYYRLGNVDLTTVEFQAPPSFEEALRDDQLMARFGGRRERIGSQVVTYHNVRGYTVPVVEKDGIAYAFTGDLDQRRLLQLVASARLP